MTMQVPVWCEVCRREMAWLPTQGHVCLDCRAKDASRHLIAHVKEHGTVLDKIDLVLRIIKHWEKLQNELWEDTVADYGHEEGELEPTVANWEPPLVEGLEGNEVFDANRMLKRWLVSHEKWAHDKRVGLMREFDQFTMRISEELGLSQSPEELARLKEEQAKRPKPPPSSREDVLADHYEMIAEAEAAFSPQRHVQRHREAIKRDIENNCERLGMDAALRKRATEIGLRYVTIVANINRKVIAAVAVVRAAVEANGNFDPKAALSAMGLDWKAHKKRFRRYYDVVRRSEELLDEYRRMMKDYVSEDACSFCGRVH